MYSFLAFEVILSGERALIAGSSGLRNEYLLPVLLSVSYIYPAPGLFFLLSYPFAFSLINVLTVVPHFFHRIIVYIVVRCVS